MSPRPPIWMSVRMIAWPNLVKWLPVSTTMRPVTHTADVAVNSESIGVMCPPTVARGVANSRAPTTIMSRNDAITVRAGAILVDATLLLARTASPRIRSTR